MLGSIWWEAFGDTHKVKTGVRLGKMSFRLVVVPKRASSLANENVKVHAGAGRASLRNWYEKSSGKVAAHEFGHMIGAIDEYPQAKSPNRVIFNDGSIMRSSSTGTVKPRHFKAIADAANKKLKGCGCVYEPKLRTGSLIE